MSNENEEKTFDIEKVTEVDKATVEEAVEAAEPVIETAVEEQAEVTEPVTEIAAETTEPATEGAAYAVEDAFEEDGEQEETTERAKVLSPGMTVLKRFFRSKLSVIGLVVIIVLFLFAFLGPLFSPWAANGGTLVDTNPALIKETLSTTYITYTVNGVEYKAVSVAGSIPEIVKLGDISGSHWMGTDHRGYDVLTRLMYGGRISLTIGFVVIILETLIGVVLGGLAGYFGKWVDNVIMRICDVLSCIPSLPIMLILSVIFNAVPGLRESVGKLYLMMMILCLLGWTGTARLVRGQILSLREQEFMLAAKALGLSTRSKIFKHLLPNVIPQLIVSMTLGLGSVILMEATLGFLNLGAPDTIATWGNMINLANDSMYRQYYANLWVGAGICITLAILAFNFVGDGLRDAFDPKMKR